jgi:hypothetical protein
MIHAAYSVGIVAAQNETPNSNIYAVRMALCIEYSPAVLEVQGSIPA